MLDKQAFRIVNCKANPGPRAHARREWASRPSPSAKSCSVPLRWGQVSMDGGSGRQSTGKPQWPTVDSPWPDSASTSMSARLLTVPDQQDVLSSGPESVISCSLSPFQNSSFYRYPVPPPQRFYWECWGGTPSPCKVMRNTFRSNGVRYSMDFRLSPRGKEDKQYGFILDRDIFEIVCMGRKGVCAGQESDC